MSSVSLEDDCSKQWEILLLLLSSEEKKIDRTNEGEVETMSYFIKNVGVRKILLQWLHQMQTSYARKTSEEDTALKCDDVAFLWRQRGNEKFRAHLLEESYKCYNKSVIYAPPTGVMYPLALANRSAALLRMKRLEECLSDIELALKSGYPSDQKHKLLLRRTDCYIEMNNAEAAKESLLIATEHSKTVDLPPSQMAELERHLQMLNKKLESMQSAEDSQEEILLPTLYLGENADFNAASNAIELRRSETAGRFVCARQAARRTDVLFSEEPFAWISLPDGEVCEGCCGAIHNPVPCRECSRSLYCGEECRARAFTSYHQWECVATRSHLLPTVGIAHLALRVLLVAASQGFPAVAGTTPSTAAELFKSYGSVDNVQIYKADGHPFFRMFNLITNFDKMNNTDYVQYALTALTLTLYLEKFTTFFEQLALGQVSEGEARLYAAGLLLRALGQLVCNGHATLALTAVDDDPDSVTVCEREVRRATAIYPSAAMMNHSCDPNIINTFYKSRLIVRASREIPAGEPVSNCYGPHRARQPTAQRRATLRAQYHFTCNCSACDNTQRDFVTLFSAYLCQSCKGPVLAGKSAHCTQCRAPLSVQRALAHIDRADDMEAQAERAVTLEHRIERTQQAFRLRQATWHRHHAALRAAADRLARLHASAGDFTKSVELIKQNIQSLEYQFGSFSVEVAHELRKLSDIMLERIVHCSQQHDYREWCLEAHKIIKKAVQLMELYYGGWEPLVKRLKEQQSVVASVLAHSSQPNATDCVHHNLHYNLKI